MDDVLSPDGGDPAALPADASAKPELVPAAHGAKRRLEIWLPLLIVALDQISKAAVRATLPLHTSVTIVPGLVDFTHVRNTGAAFGILNLAEFPYKTVVIAVIATAALIGVGLYAASLAHHQFVARLGLALIIGGATGNLVDRIAAGSVVDFVDVYWGTHHFWAFNVADSAITIGVAVMILDMLGSADRDQGSVGRDRARREHHHDD
jgi:signal peptidase II